MLQLLHSRRCSLLFVAIAFAVVAIGSTASAAPPIEDEVQLLKKIATPKGIQPVHWRVTWNANPAAEAIVSWNTVEAGKSHQLHLRSEDGSDKRTIECQTSGKFSGMGTLFYHHARLSDLKPETKYYVVCESDEQKSPEMWFLTAPDQDKAVRLLFGGDSRSGHADRRRMNRRMAHLVHESPEILALAHGGDYIVTGLSLPQWKQWMADHELTVTDEGRLLPVIPARGNHDIGPLFDEVFGFPERDKNYYALDLTPQVRIVTLNSEISMAGDQKKWLKKQLADARPKYRWLIAQYHRPAWPAVKRPSAALQHFVPLFEKHNVDLVCEADGHNLKRTVPIRAGKQHADGIVYIGEGGLGVGQRKPKADRWFLQEPGLATQGHHVHVLTFNPDRLDVKAVALDGSTLDQYTREPRK